jgi:hypothetical protein
MPPLPSVQTELIGPLDLSKVKEGSLVLARVIADYRNQDCSLRVGAILEGHIAQVLHGARSQNSSEVQIAFDKADCNDQPSSGYKFTLIALVAPPEEAPFDPDKYRFQGPALADATVRNETYFSNFRDPLRGAFQEVPVNRISRPTAGVPTNVSFGQVVGVSKTNLSVGAGIDGATVISTTARDPRLHAHSILVFSPSSAMLIAKPGATTAYPGSQSIASLAPLIPVPSPHHSDVISASIAPPSLPPDETEVCSAGCSIIGSMTSRVKGATSISASIPITALGYSPRIKGFVSSFDDETTLTYLDETHLLCTFDPHHLRLRDSDSTDPIRAIRAVLIDTTTHTIQKVMEWHVRGDHSYLWHLGNGQVLVHNGDQLRRFDASLNALQSILVAGPVAWVVSSPSSDHIAVAILHQRYSESVYKELRKLEADPDQDLQVSVYDSKFNLLSTSIRSAQTLAPVLSDQGELRLTRHSRDHWKLTNYGWDKSQHTIATVTSACTPRLSVPEHDLIFITGCTPTSTGSTAWYRVLRSDGHTLLNGDSPPDETVQSVHGSFANSFAVRVFKSVRPIDPNQAINRSDYIREEIGIYRATNGSRLSSIAADDFILAQNSYALSPQGDQMALAGKNAILFYDVKLP